MGLENVGANANKQYIIIQPQQRINYGHFQQHDGMGGHYMK
jgi:hypothetical protein